MGPRNNGREFTAYSVSPDHFLSVVRPEFVASTSAFLKFNGSCLLVVGQTRGPTSGIEFLAETVSRAVRLPIGTQSLLLNEPASELTDGFRELVLPEIADGGSDLSIHDLVSKIECIVRGKSSQDRNCALVDAILDAAAQGPHSSVEALTRICGYSSRHLQRIFLKYTGFSTKEFLEILRFENSLTHNSLGIHDQRFRSADPRERYYDQSHYIKNFRRFSGKTPSQFSKAMSDPYNTSAGAPFMIAN